MSMQSNRRTQNWSRYVIKVQNGHLDFILRLQFLCRIENSMYQHSVLLTNWATTNLLPNKLKAVCEFVWVKDVTSCFSQAWGQKWGGLPLLSLVTDASTVKKHCWLLEGKVTQPIEQQAEIISLLAIVIRSPDTPLWQEIQIKPPGRSLLHGGGVFGWAQD